MFNIATNIGISLLTLTSQVVSGTVIFVLLARMMTPNDFGLISFGSVFAGLIAVISEFGFSLMAQKDIPQKKYSFQQYIFNSISQKTIISCVTILLGLTYLKTFFVNDNVVIGSIFLFGGILTSKIMYFGAVFRAKNMFSIESISFFIYALLSVLTIILTHLLSLNVYQIAWCLFFSRLLHLISLIVFFVKKFGLLKFQFDRSIQRYLFKNSYSYGLLFIIGTFYFTIDSQLIVYFLGNESLAIYQSFFKIVTLVLIINEIFSNVFLPYLSSIYEQKGKFFEGAKKANVLVFMLGLITFVFVNFFSEYILTSLYSDKYIAALKLAFPLSGMLYFRILASIYAVVLTISDNQNRRVIIVLISLILNVTLNIYVIPKFGILGAAYVSFFTLFVLFCLYFLFSYNLLKESLIDFSLVRFSFFTISVICFLKISGLNFGLTFSIIAFLFWLLILLSQVKVSDMVKFVTTDKVNHTNDI
ncbi:oligosaccharide flippase family protein [Jiulongibacter sediminis]|uniref:oligosaccharide flippase family protein n=1 Tax=Jiulongibacter sediminis TaxID=1605367 RepID=UPI0026EF5F2C|nr:oligosaccharide flippase family protein [Jiulongibacter sediminis]